MQHRQLLKMSNTDKPTDTDTIPAIESKIKFSGLVSENAKLVKGNSIIIYPSTGGKHISSSDVKLQIVMNNNLGRRSPANASQILAVHKSGDFIAYGIKLEKDGQGALRVIHLEQNDRILIKGLTGMPQQISFAVNAFPILVACIDETGDIFINEIVPTIHMNTMHNIPRAHITQDGDGSMDPAHLLRWCPYSPEEDQDKYMTDNLSRLFIAARKNKVEIYDVIAVSAYGEYAINPGELTDGYTCVTPSTYFVTDMTMSPDGTTLAVTTNAGNVMFYQIQFRDGTCLTTNCLHEWWPHESKVLTCLLFLDNLEEPESSSFWKFVVTGAQNNRELKVWSCETWVCLQTIKFVSRNPSALLNLKAFIDPSTNNILLSDVTNCKLYLMEITKEKHTASIFRVTEFSFPSPLLSIHILDTNDRYYSRNDSSLDHLYYCPKEVKAESNKEIECCTVTESYVVLPESLSLCTLIYNKRPVPKNLETPANGAIRDEYKNVVEGIKEVEDKKDNELTKLALMKVNGVGKEQCNQRLIADESEKKLMLASSSSSPSREVEEILCSKDGHINQFINEPESWNKLAALNQAESLIVPIPLSSEIGTKPTEVIQKEIKKKINRPIEDDSNALIIKEDNNDTSITLLTDLANRQNKMEDMLESLNKKMDEVLKSKCVNEELSNLVEVSVTNAIKRSLSNDVQRMVQNEIKSKVVPAMKSELNNVTKDLQRSLTKKNYLPKHLLDESVNTIIYTIDEVMTDVIPKSLPTTLTPIFSKYMSEEFSRVFLPRFDSTFHNMFEQLNYTFYKGLESIISNVENTIIVNTKESLEKGIRMQTQANHIMSKANEALEGVKKTICSTQETLVKLEEISNRLSVTPKNVFTPIPIVHFTELSLVELINRGDITRAIEKVLSSSDGRLLSLLVDKLPVEVVFHKERNLKQNHILSLIYQLASDLSSQTAGRCRYMERAMTHVDPDHPVSKQHLIKVMSYTKAAINNFLTVNPSHPEIQSFRLLLIVIDGMLAKGK